MISTWEKKKKKEKASKFVYAESNNAMREREGELIT